jgi:hypothetical protein
MRTLLLVVVLLLVGVAGFGFYRGWFHFSTDNADHRPSATIAVDEDKIHADEQKAKERMQGLEQKVKGKAGN